MNEPAIRHVSLDVLRTSAVVAVVLYHAVRMSPVDLPLRRITAYGSYGVDLFFVLSGFLIGGLIWREVSASGRLDARTFWLRRALRTMPPYFVSLGISWTGVAIARGEKFDWGYLVFVQNYYERMPYFSVSWSLCVEEHFYAFVAIAAAFAVGRVRNSAIISSLILMILMSPAIRYAQYAEDSGKFGYQVTATYFNMDGLLLGLLVSLLVECNPGLPKLLASRVGIGCVAMLAGAAIWLHRAGDDLITYVFVPTVHAVLFASTLLAGMGSAPAVPQRIANLFRKSAVCSYSVYLVHPIAIQATLVAVGPYGGLKGLLYWPVLSGAVLSLTALFYFAVERPSILVRDRLLPLQFG